MTVAEFAKFWNNFNRTELTIKYYYNNKCVQLFNLYRNNSPISSIKITITQAPFTSDHATIYSTTYTEFSQTQSQFYDTLRTHIPVGSFVYTLNIFIN